MFYGKPTQQHGHHRTLQRHRHYPNMPLCQDPLPAVPRMFIVAHHDWTIEKAANHPVPIKNDSTYQLIIQLAEGPDDPKI
jgi:hypothetical protein